MVAGGPINKSVISPEHYKGFWKAIHQKNGCCFVFLLMFHNTEWFILQKWRILNRFSPFYFLNTDISLGIRPQILNLWKTFLPREGIFYLGPSFYLRAKKRVTFVFFCNLFEGSLFYIRYNKN